MEFGATIPLFFMGLCFCILTPLIGSALLLFIRFSSRDIVLARNIFITVLIVCLLWFVFPMGQLIYAAIAICRECPDSDFRLTGEIFLSTVSYAFRLALMPGTASGFLFAFFVVAPATMIVRRSRKVKDKAKELEVVSKNKSE